MKYLVEALDTYKEMGITDEELGLIPEEGKQFEVSKERLDLLLGNNQYNKVFVKLIKEVNEDAIKKGNIKQDSVKEYKEISKREISKKPSNSNKFSESKKK